MGPVDNDLLVNLETALSRLALDLASASDATQAVQSVQNSLKSGFFTPLESFPERFLSLLNSSDESLSWSAPPGLAVPHRWAHLVGEFATEAIRNWRAHGQESRVRRKFEKKSEVPRALVQVQVTSSGVQVEFHDDGPGLVVEQMLERLNLFSGWTEGQKQQASEAAASSDFSQLMQVVFEEGWSSSVEVNLQSGRGMGLSRLRQVVVREGGKISAGRSSALGGFLMRAELPVSLLAAPVFRGKNGLELLGDRVEPHFSSEVLYRLPAESLGWSREVFSPRKIFWMKLVGASAISGAGVSFDGVELNSP
ncbi:MAG: hypothetical protein RJB38_1676 [Pseudomonadota bacterium]|jgi:hypothetical protein